MPEGVSSNSPVEAPRALVQQILCTYRRVAIVGLSANPYRPSHFVAVYLKAAGFDIVPVNPNEDRILGLTCYARLRDIPEPVEIVDIFREPSAVPAIVEDAIATGAKVVWMQFGVIHEEAAARARKAGLLVVMDRCLKIEHARYCGGLSTMGLNAAVLSSRKRQE